MNMITIEVPFSLSGCSLHEKSKFIKIEGINFKYEKETNQITSKLLLSAEISSRMLRILGDNAKFLLRVGFDTNFSALKSIEYEIFSGNNY